jgi:hypothetical protein
MVLAFNKSEIEYQQVQRELQQLEQQKRVTIRLEKLEASYNALCPAPQTQAIRILP